jgi:hypothetical protein
MADMLEEAFDARLSVKWLRWSIVSVGHCASFGTVHLQLLNWVLTRLNAWVVLRAWVAFLHGQSGQHQKEQELAVERCCSCSCLISFWILMILKMLIILIANR